MIKSYKFSSTGLTARVRSIHQGAGRLCHQQTHDRRLVCRALNMAIKNKGPSQGLIVHSDRGSQYCSHAYHNIIKQQQFIGSMSGKGNCYDNARIESFWGVLKNELVYHQDYKTRFAAISDIIKYVELYYNQTRIQKGLGYKSPRQVWFNFYRQAA